MKNIQKIVSHVPNFITSLNVLSGSIAVVMAFETKLIYASLFIAIAALFDFLDGMAARALKAYSEIGKQLDSLADMVSFGFAPSVIMFQLIKITLNREGLFFDLSSASPAVMTVLFSAFIITIFSALRLAKFNIDTRQTNSFIGLPTPANAIMIASLPLILAYNDYWAQNIILNIYFLVILTFFMSYMLIAEFPMFSLKFKNLTYADNKLRFFFLASTVVLISILKFTAIPIVIFVYILLSAINNWIIKKEE